MDLADATLAALGQSVAVKRVFTLNQDFHIYRFKGKQAFEVIP
jgi:predicted nucleic acid-binding protein